MTVFIPVAGVAALAAALAGGPTAAQFNAALAAACPDRPAQTRSIACDRDAPDSIQFNCRYQMRGEGGAWASHVAILQLAEGEWVWIDGPTPCSGEDTPELN